MLRRGSVASDAPASPDPEPEPAKAFAIDVVEGDLELESIGLDRQMVSAVAARLVAVDAVAAILPATAALVISDDLGVRDLNERWRGKAQATNVLSFPARVPPGLPADEPRPLGDVVIAAETVHREAAELGVPLAHHATHLLVHGLLHLVGLDHERPEDADAMEALEVAVLADLGVADPYADSVPVADDACGGHFNGVSRTTEP